MTAQEQQLIDSLVERIRNTPAADKDDEADRYLHQQLSSAPDALYVLAQTVLVQQYGLQNAQQQIADLQAQLQQAQQQPKKSGSFLSHLLGTDEPPQQPQAPPYQPVNTGYSAPPPPPTGYAPAPYGYGAPSYGSGSGGGFLRGALQTAAGVAAGEMFFQGMEGLFHGFGGGGYGYGGRPEVVENNYYNDDRPHEAESHAANTGDGNFYNPDNDASRDLSPDIEDRRGFADTGDNNTDDSGGTFDDGSGNDGSGFDDSGSFDDGGGDFGGGDDSSF
jgi:hypothetical protein